MWNDPKHVILEIMMMTKNFPTKYPIRPPVEDGLDRLSGTTVSPTIVPICNECSKRGDIWQMSLRFVDDKPCWLCRKETRMRSPLSDIIRWLRSLPDVY
jgi:hypothetical protein